MGLTSEIENLAGVVTVQIEGFFTERFINLCRINNIKIWNIRNIVKGVIRFEINVKNFRKLRPIAKKTKCKISIKNKKGIYFKLFKYRKRKLAFILIFLIFLFSIIFSTFIWNIEVTGNQALSRDQIIADLKNSGLYIGKSKLGFDKKEIVNSLRTKQSEISWAGIEIDGTKARVKVVEKTRLDDSNIQNVSTGDIIATKSGVITKIVAENGTAKYKNRDYIQMGTVLIEGNIYSKKLELMGSVCAKGYARIDSVYSYKSDYFYNELNKQYTSKKRWTIGITINSKENMLNYLNKSKKYDISKSSKSLIFFNNNISLDLYECDEYEEVPVINSKEELEKKAKEDADRYLKSEILPNCINPNVIDTTFAESDIDGGIHVNIEYVVNEQIGKFVERGV